ncbi:MAG: PLP-dependent aminotransferase family protein [Candidatus Cloacimonetes bacterium]|nr:PLP-dependent aminotransferase family protein [Candidatus Cloacimonadota bacterium]
MITNWNDRFSDNIREFEGYSIGKIMKYLNDPNIISLAGGLPSPDMFLKTGMRIASKQRLEEDIDTIMQYTSVPGEKSLVDAIIGFLARDSINISPENLIVTSSGQHGLDLTGRLFLNHGDTIIIDRPTFAGAIVAFSMQRINIVGIDIESDGANVDVYEEKLEAMKKKGIKPKFMYAVPDFQNPSGITCSKAKREKLLDLSYKYDVPIIEDSPYRDLRYTGETIPSIYELDQKRDGNHVIGLYTFSKIFCPGIRVGFNIGPKEVIERMINIKEGNILNTPKFNQDMCTEFLTTMGLEEHLENCRNYYGDKLNLFLETMEEYFPPEMGVTWTKPDGGLFLWVTVPEHIDTNDLFMDALKYNVAFVPGDVFYGENPALNHMRINYSFASKDQLVEAVKRLSGCLRERLSKS